MNSTNFSLRRSIQPYVGLGIILFLVSLFVVAATFQQSDHSFALIMVSGSVFFVALNAFIGTRYRVYWTDEAVGMHAVGSIKDVVIPVDKITLIQEETSLQR